MFRTRIFPAVFMFLCIGSAYAHHEAAPACDTLGKIPGACLQLAENAEPPNPVLERHYSVDSTRNRRPPRDRWGAVAVQGESVYFAWGHDITSFAQDTVMRQCERSPRSAAGGCEVVAAFRQCAAAAAAYHGDVVVIQEGATLEAARLASEEECRIRSKDNCTGRWAYCADGTGGIVDVPNTWGALARPADGGGEVILITGRKEAATALTESNWHCEQVNKRECQPLFHFAQCGAYAEGASGASFAWARAATLEDAQSDALDSCNGSGAACTVTASGCTTQ